ncbi:MAG: 1-acyl-sn-glycerol-3-phosphate acyltransferase [Chloroflexi bacterium]|nr:1-acyl-sn-glycerol-3-phosphate acyltransferase [Chloroflexota bacterium]
MNTVFEPHTRPPLWYRGARLAFIVLARWLFKVRIVGRANIPRGSYIVVANHLSWIDPFLLMVALPAEPRLYFIGAQQAINRDWKMWLMRRVDILIPFERGALWLGKDLLKKSFDVLQSGAILGIFPEGTLGSREGELLALQRGIGHLLLRNGATVLPVALSGAQELYLGKPITVTIGKPFVVAVAGLDRQAAIAAAIAQVERALRAILPPYVEPNVRIKRMRFLTNLLG